MDRKLFFILAYLDSDGNPLTYHELLGKGNPGGIPGDCPRGFVCLKKGNCGGITVKHCTEYKNNEIIMMNKFICYHTPSIMRFQLHAF